MVFNHAAKYPNQAMLAGVNNLTQMNITVSDVFEFLAIYTWKYGEIEKSDTEGEFLHLI